MNEFQSLRRDSVGSHFLVDVDDTYAWIVSIPQAGFCRFTPGSGVGERILVQVSIPQAGFCRFTLRRVRDRS